MTETPMPRAEQEPPPRWVRSVVRWLGLTTTLIGALTALLLALGKFGDAVYAPCKNHPALPWCSTGVPLSLTPYDSGSTAGGHTQAEYCEPRAAAYRSQHPNYTITWRGSETNDKDWLGHVTYKYHCEFIATPTGWSLGLWLAIGGLTIGLVALLWWRRHVAGRA